MITPATPADAAATIALWQACGLTRPWNDPQADFDRALASASATILIIRDGGAIIGSIMIGDDGHRGWVYYLAASPERQRSGMGRDLMAAAEDWLRARGCAKLQLMVREDNAAAAGFYAALGYAQQPVVTMGKRLDA
jgi:ribosomal protein S18 acetylase RimI-like enzyme